MQPTERRRDMTKPSQLCVGAIIRNHEGRVFVQHRASTRRVLPGTWDIVGGHVEPPESVGQALEREIAEETGWRLRRIVTLVGDWEWEHEGLTRGELDFLVEVDGDLTDPRLEATKHDAYAWIGLDELRVLRDGAAESVRTLCDIVEKCLDTRFPCEESP